MTRKKTSRHGGLCSKPWINQSEKWRHHVPLLDITWKTHLGLIFQHNIIPLLRVDPIMNLYWGLFTIGFTTLLTYTILVSRIEMIHGRKLQGLERDRNTSHSLLSKHFHRIRPHHAVLKKQIQPGIFFLHRPWALARMLAQVCTCSCCPSEALDHILQIGG